MALRSRRGIELKTPDQIRRMRRAGLVVHDMLTTTAAAVRPGVTTAELNAVAADVLERHGARSNFLDYGADHRGVGGFTGVVCLSPNEVIVHGMPTDRVLHEGDLLSIDGGAIVDGWHGDSAITVGVGTLSDEDTALSRVTEEALWAGIAAMRVGSRIADVGAAIEDVIESAAAGYGIVEEYVGHGIGTAMHQPPDVPNYRILGRSPRIVEGMVLCIEPMVTIGSPHNQTLADGWTVTTCDGSRAAHWELTATATRDGVWVLSAPDGGEERLNALGVPFAPLGE